MINEKAVRLLEQTIINLYDNIRLDNMSYDNDEFYYEFKSDVKVSENDFIELENSIHQLDNSCYVKLLRISGVYLNFPIFPNPPK